jgi:hypothetical protein
MQQQLVNAESDGEVQVVELQFPELSGQNSRRPNQTYQAQLRQSQPAVREVSRQLERRESEKQAHI